MLSTERPKLARAAPIAPWLGCALAMTLAMALAAGCGGAGEGGEEQARRGSSQVGGVVVSTVNGHPIRLEDIERLARAAGLTPEQALERLQAEELLMAEAERRRVSGAAVELVAERTRVQALLDRVTADVVASDGEIKAAYERDERFHRPELRASFHVLARAASSAKPEQVEAARAVALKALADMKALDDAALAARYTGAIDGVQVKAEAVPSSPPDGRLVREYLSALFSLSAPGVVGEVVRTRFGFHAIRVTEITPRFDAPYDEAAAVLRDEITNEKRAAAVEALLTELRRAHSIAIPGDVGDKLSLVEAAEALWAP